MSAGTGLADQAAVEGSFLLAAAAETRTALAPVGETYTAFTGALLEALRQGIPGGPALVDLGVLYRHLRVSMEARGHPVPQARDRNSGAQVALGRNHADLPAAPVAAAAGVDAGERLWPDPRAIRTVAGFFTALAQVRVVSGLTHRAVSERSAGRMAAGTVGALLNRSTLPTTWGTTAVYLSACGVPDEQITQWQTAWQQLRAQILPAQTESREVTDDGGPGKARAWQRPLSALRRRRDH
jgi:hypothetical protein